MDHNELRAAVDLTGVVLGISFVLAVAITGADSLETPMTP